MGIETGDLIAATFVAVAALAKRLTGADMLVTIKDADGTVWTLKEDDGAVIWIEPGQPLIGSQAAVDKASSEPRLADRLTILAVPSETDHEQH